MTRIFLILFLLISSNLYSFETDWKLMGQPSDGYVRTLDCSDSNNCFIITAGTTLTKILTSSDKGVSWDLRYIRDADVYDPPYVNNTWGGVSPSPSHFYLYYFRLGEIHKSIDSGRTFERITLYEGSRNLEEIAMKGTNVGIALNYYNIYVTFDGWETFETRERGIPKYNNFLYLEFISDSIVQCICHNSERTIKYTGASIVNYNIYTDVYEELHQFLPKEGQVYSDGFDFLEIVSDSVSYVSGSRRLGKGDLQVDIIAKTTDGGRTWKNVLDKEYEPRWGLLAISFYDENNGFISGRAGKVLMTNDGGQTWKYETPTEIFGKDDDMRSTSIDWAGQTPIIGSNRGYIYRYEGDYFVFDGNYKGNLTISGRVTDNGVGVEGISIFNGEVYTSTDSEGYYKYPHLEAGKYRIAPEDPDYNFEVSEIIVQLDESRENIDFETSKRDRFFRFSGRVTLNGEGVYNAVIDADYYRAYTDSNGYYEIPKMHKSDIDEPYIGAYYTISARNSKYHFLPEKRILRLVSDTSGFDFYYDTETSVKIAEHLPIYPNPATDFINIDDSHNYDRIEVYDSRVNLVLLEIENLHRIDIRELSAGSYFIYLYKRSKGIEVVKFIVKR